MCGCLVSGWSGERESFSQFHTRRSAVALRGRFGLVFRLAIRSASVNEYASTRAHLAHSCCLPRPWCARCAPWPISTQVDLGRTARAPLYQRLPASLSTAATEWLTRRPTGDTNTSRISCRECRASSMWKTRRCSGRQLDLSLTHELRTTWLTSITHYKNNKYIKIIIIRLPRVEYEIHVMLNLFVKIDILVTRVLKRKNLLKN